MVFLDFLSVEIVKRFPLPHFKSTSAQIKYVTYTGTVAPLFGLDMDTFLLIHPCPLAHFIHFVALRTISCIYDV